MFAGTWLLTAPALLNYENAALAWSDALCGLLVIGLSFLAIHVRFAMVRWGIAAPPAAISLGNTPLNSHHCG